ncbi:MAG: DUF917 domain-containing protein [Candidatus Acidiferrales bacterium]
MRTLTKQNLEDIIVGCSFLGTGGGGSFSHGMKRIYDDLDAGLVFKLMSPQEMKDDDYAAAPYGVGSTAPPTEEEKQRYAKLPRIKEESTTAAFRLLQKYMNKTFVATIAGEIGPGNTPAAMSAAAHIGIAQLDADTVGRAAPEIDQNVVLAAGLQITPAAGATAYGDELILAKIAATSREEDFFRAASMVSMGIGVTDTPIAGRDAKREGVLVQGSISHAEEVGKAYRIAVETHRDPIQAVLDAGHGYRLFEGKIADFKWKDQGGYLVGDVEISGSGKYQGSAFKIAYKNENLVSWRDGKFSVTCPDLITMVIKDSGKAIANPDFEKGQETVVIGFISPPNWRTPLGLELFGPRRFGFDTPYVPIEQMDWN